LRLGRCHRIGRALARPLLEQDREVQLAELRAWLERGYESLN
jgi:hypothetical protein